MQKGINKPRLKDYLQPRYQPLQVKLTVFITSCIFCDTGITLFPSGGMWLHIWTCPEHTRVRPYRAKQPYEKLSHAIVDTFCPAMCQFKQNFIENLLLKVHCFLSLETKKWNSELPRDWKLQVDISSILHKNANLVRTETCYTYSCIIINISFSNTNQSSFVCYQKVN